MDNYNYPVGADTKDAPWNQEDPPEEEVEVLVSVTLSKTVKIKVTDYEVDEGVDEDGYYRSVDFKNCDLKSAVEEQIALPQEAVEDWNVDEMEVVLDD